MRNGVCAPMRLEGIGGIRNSEHMRLYWPECFFGFFFFSCFFFSRNCYGKMCALWVSMSLVNLVETELFQKVSEVSFLTNLSCKRFGQKLQIQNFPLKTNEWTFEGYY